MDQIKQLWARLSWTQRISIAVAAAAVAGGLATLDHWNEERNFKPLFSGLATEDAGAMMAKLRETAIEYRLSDNGSTILVPSEKVAEMRLQLAAAGLPKSGRIGYELFDRANFGASEFTEQVNYHRAMEGELERSVMSIREVEAARVHITMAKDSLYTESRQPAKASILIKLRRAAALSPQSIAAICQLAASAVPSLAPGQVSVMDTNGNLLNRARQGGVGDGSDASEASLDYRKSIERDLQNKISATLEPLLGAEHFRVGVSADVNINSGDQSEELFDPKKPAIASPQKTQDGPSRRAENVNYQTSRTVKHLKMPQGGVKRLSLSVLVDHTVRMDGGRRMVEAPSEEKLKVIRDMTAAAAGLDTTRGDQLAVESFPFELTLTPEPLALPAAPAGGPASRELPEWLTKLMANKRFPILAGAAGGALLCLLAGLAFLRIRSKPEAQAAATPAVAGAPVDAIGGAAEARLADHAAERARIETEALLQLKTPKVSTKTTDALSKHFSSEAKKNPAAMAQVVRGWLQSEAN